MAMGRMVVKKLVWHVWHQLCLRVTPHSTKTCTCTSLFYEIVESRKKHGHVYSSSFGHTKNSPPFSWSFGPEKKNWQLAHEFFSSNLIHGGFFGLTKALDHFRMPTPRRTKHSTRNEERCGFPEFRYMQFEWNSCWAHQIYLKYISYFT